MESVATAAAGRTTAIRLCLILIFPLMVISSSIFIFINPAVVAINSSYSSSSSPLPTISTVPSAPSTIGQDGKDGDFTAQAALGSATARPTNNNVNTNSFYDIVFVTSTAGAIKRIQVTFPAGTHVPISASFIEAEGIGKGSVTKSGQTLTYTVTNAVNVPAGTKIRLEFSNINNPVSPSANYKVTVTTRNAANAIIDGPTRSAAYTMKQIGTNALAANSVTASKIAPGAIVPQVFNRDGDSVSAKPLDFTNAEAFCLAGEAVTGGGYFMINGPGKLFLVNEFPSPSERSWNVQVYNTDTVAHNFLARAECMQAMP